MKGISIVERHFEKGILALVALAVGGFALWDVFTVETTKMGGAETKVGEIAQKLETLSREVSKAQDGTQVAIEIPQVPEGATNASAMFDKPATSADPLPKAMPQLASSLFSKASRPVPLYHEPSFGPVKMVSPVVQSDGALKILAGKDDELAKLLDERPAGWQKGDLDAIWTTPVAEVDLAAIRAEMEKAETGATPPREKLPLHWWQQRDRSVCVLDVRFERQEQKPDGSWGDTVVVDPLPGVATFRGVDLPDVGAVVDRMKANTGMQERLLRPPFPALAQGTAVDPRGGAGGAAAPAGESKELVAARKSLEKAKERLTEVAAKLEEAGGEYTEAPPPPKGGRGKGKGGAGGDSSPPTGGSGGGGGKGGPGGPSGGGAGPGAGPGGSNDPNSPAGIRKRRTLMGERDKAKAEVAKIESQIGQMTKPAAAGQGASAAATNDRFLVWAHDLKVRPSAVYRYRCVLSILNPFLGRAGEVQDSQKALASKSGVLTAPSEWVTVRMRSPRDFFVIEGLPGEGASGLGLGRFDLFKLNKGQWCAQRQTIELGDRVGGVLKTATAGSGKESDVDFTTDWFVIGVYRDFAAEAEQARSGKKGAEGAGASSDRQMIVVLANANDPTQIVVRRPSEDAANPDRSFLAQRAAPAKPATPATGDAPASGAGKKG